MHHAVYALKPFSPFGGLANSGSILNIHVYLRSSAADCFFGLWLFRAGVPFLFLIKVHYATYAAGPHSIPLGRANQLSLAADRQRGAA
jgi:hypothetical protein